MPDAKKILIIEDDNDLAQAMLRRLKSCGYDAVAAGDAIEGIKSVRDNAPDLIMLDLMLPVGGGLSFIEKLRRDYFDIPIIVCSGTSDEDYKQKVLAAGVNAFFEKPYDSKEVIKTIKSIIG